MIKSSFIQFRFPWDRVKVYLPEDIQNDLQKPYSLKERYPYITVDSEHKIVDYLINKNFEIDGNSLVRLIREEVAIKENEINEDSIYEFQYLKSFKHEALRLSGEPSAYYDVKTICAVCGHYKWDQKREIEIKGILKAPIMNVENGELIISPQLKDILIDSDIENIKFLKVKNIDAWQITSKESIMILDEGNQYVQNKDICSNCKSPRIRVYENSNKIDLFKPPHTIPRIEGTPILLIKNMAGDFAFTDLEFGTLGRLPEGSPALEASEFTYKTSWPKIAVTGKFLKVLYQAKVKGIKVTPAEIV